MRGRSIARDRFASALIGLVTAWASSNLSTAVSPYAESHPTAGYLMPEEQEQDGEEEDEDDEMDADFTPEMADRLRGMITMGTIFPCRSVELYSCMLRGQA